MSHRTRKHRRSSKMVLRSGGKFAVNHRGKSGRTGHMQTRKTPGAYEYRSGKPNPPPPFE